CLRQGQPALLLANVNIHNTVCQYGERRVGSARRVGEETSMSYRLKGSDARIPPAHLEALRQPPFSNEEYRRRLRETQVEIGRHDLDALVCTFGANVCYLTGFETIDHFAPTILIVSANADPVLLTSDFE